MMTFPPLPHTGSHCPAYTSLHELPNSSIYAVGVPPGCHLQNIALQEHQYRLAEFLHTACSTTDTASIQLVLHRLPCLTS